MIYVCPWRSVQAQVTAVQASHVVSLLGVEGRPPLPDGIEPGNHLDLEVDDIADVIQGLSLIHI